jgi:MFS transporter, AAHS family, 4-hydroxybenzoate transporter
MTAPADPATPAAGRSPWTPAATLIVGLCFAINMVDGMDIVIMSFIAPALAIDWDIAPDALGIVFSAGLLGMAIGGLLIAPTADRFGRRRLILAALALMSAGMIGSGFVTTVPLLVAARIVVGAGIGTALATMAALVAEAAPASQRNLAVGVVQAGYPLAAVFTGLVAAQALPTWGWQPLLLAAGLGTLLMLPIAWRVLRAPDSGAAARAAPPPALRTLFGDGLRTRTLWLWVAVFFGLMVLYFIVSWIPKLSIDAGLSETNGIYAGALYNFGAFVGTLLMSYWSVRVPLARLVAALLSASGIAMLVFGSVPMSVPLTLGVAFVIGVTLQGGYNGVWPLAAAVYPAARRATGIGWAMGIGRSGAIIGPLLGGYLLAAGSPLPLLFAVYCVPLAVCVLAVLMVGDKPHAGGRG